MPGTINSISDLIIPQASAANGFKNFPFSNYLLDSNNFKNILLTCDRFQGFIQMLPKYTPKCILFAKAVESA
jgi:hypothetical protein